jgi:hypothetical protein
MSYITTRSLPFNYFNPKPSHQSVLEAENVLGRDGNRRRKTSQPRKRLFEIAPSTETLFQAWTCKLALFFFPRIIEIALDPGKMVISM